jgi:acetyl esterase/lipase
LILLSGCSEFDVVNALVPTGSYRKLVNIPYGSLPRQKLDVYEPRVGKPAGIVVFFYGGSWQHGAKGEYLFVGQALASRGYIAVLPDYRLYPQVKFPAFVQDGALAIRWVHDHARQIGGDPSHIYLMGHSAGAHIAALLTLDPRYLQAVKLKRSDIRATVGLAGPYDFPVSPGFRKLFGATSTTQPMNPAMEPINFVDGHEPPMLLLQGGGDTTVEPGNAIRLAAKIRKSGGQVQLIIYPKRGHVSLVAGFAYPLRWLEPPVLADAVAFFHSH